MVHISASKRLLCGAMVGATAAFVLQGGVGALISAKVAAISQAIFAGASAPLAAGEGFSVTACLTWSVIGGAMGYLLGNFLEGDGKLKYSYAVVMTAVIGALFVAVAVNLQLAVTTFFILTTVGYAMLKDLESQGYFSFKSISPDITFRELPGAYETYLDEIGPVMGRRDLKAVRILLAGPPGTGKSSIAKAIAATFKHKVIVVRSADLHAADPIDRALRVDWLFRKAGLTKSVILLEEFEVVGRNRSEASAGSALSDEIGILMGKLEDLNEARSGLIIIATTNYPDKIDPAVLRPGRFDRVIQIGLPNKSQRQKIIDYYREKINYRGSSEYIDASRMEGWSGADIASLIKAATSGEEAIAPQYKDICWRIKMAKNQPRAPRVALREEEMPPDQKERIKALLNQVLSLLSMDPSSLSMELALPEEAS